MYARERLTGECRLTIRETSNAHHGQVLGSGRGGKRCHSQRQAGKVFEQRLEYLKPEAGYFYPGGGERAGFFVVNMEDSWQVADTVERFFFGLDAKVELTPVINGEDLHKALSGVPDIVERYG